MPRGAISPRVIAGKAKVQKLQDYQKTGKLSTQAVLPSQAPQETKVARYRDRLLSAVEGHIQLELFERLRCRSMQMLGTRTENAELALYSDICQYAELCDQRGVSPLPFEDHAIIACLAQVVDDLLLTAMSAAL